MLPTDPSTTPQLASRAWLLSACVALAACGDDARAKARAADVASFDQVWTIVRDRHFDPAIGGLDWEAVRAELRPKVLAARDRAGARAVMREMIGRLGLSHFAIIETGDDDEPSDRDGTLGLVGLDVRSIGDEIFVTEVSPDGPAELAGVKLGWRVDAIDGEPVADLLADARRSFRDSTLRPAEEYVAVFDKLIGSTRTPVEVTFEDGAGRVVVTRLEREDASDQVVSFGHLVGLVAYDSRRIGAARDVGYIRVGAFLDPSTVMKRYRADLASMKEVRGLVIDLRGNTGGLGPMASGMAGALLRKEARLGTSHGRDSERHTVANPQPDPYDGPVAVLVDELSMSTSEIFAAGVQELGRARLFGRRTPGAALPSTLEKLPNGDVFQFAVARYVTAGGRVLEGQGVEPDELVPLVRPDLLAGGDAPLEAALGWIERQRTETEEASP